MYTYILTYQEFEGKVNLSGILRLSLSPTSDTETLTLHTYIHTDIHTNVNANASANMHRMM